MSEHRFESRSAITGIGRSAIGRRLHADPLGLTLDACLAAVDDAGLELDDIDGLCSWPGESSHPGFSGAGAYRVQNALGLRPAWLSSGFETPGQAAPIVTAMLAVAAGLCRHVLTFRSIWESTAIARARANGNPSTNGRVGGLRQYSLPMGVASPANWIAMLASRHMHEYGTTREQLGQIALVARRHAADNPWALYRDPLTLEDYLAARPISEPLGLYDCDVPCDGAVAVVVSAADGAVDRRHPPVWFEAVGTRIDEPISWDQGALTHEPGQRGCSEMLWQRTTLRPRDVDFAEIYDGFTFIALSWIERLGFCPVGEGGSFVDGGTRISRGGELPMNLEGGQLSGGRLHGFGFVHEAVEQLRGAAGPRQVEGAETGLVAVGGGIPGTCMILRADR